jgi:hypothetical protein
MKKPEVALGARSRVPMFHCAPPAYPDSCELCFAGMTATHYYIDPDGRITEHRYGRCEKHINGLPCLPIPECPTTKSSTSAEPLKNETS